MAMKLNRRDFAKKTLATAGVAAAGLYIPSVLEAAGKDEWADLTGRFVVEGTPPEPAKLKVDKDVECCGKFDLRDESLTIGKDGGLANVYVYLRTKTREKVDICPELAKSVPKHVVLDNRDCIFKPHCMSIWTDKQELSIVNSDPVAQNVAFSPLGGKPANIVLPAPPDKASKATWTFKKKQRLPVTIACNYHPWEVAYILPLDHPYCAISKDDGTFTIPKLPVGKNLEFQVWQERIGYLATDDWKLGRIKIKIKPGKNDLGTIKLQLDKFPKNDNK
ncbi:MAG: hypothetical protein JXM70_05170 [Pirellulales bacterium]|nr:hypothetical protein [Pirellulales bacterium]